MGDRLPDRLGGRGHLEDMLGVIAKKVNAPCHSCRHNWYSGDQIPRYSADNPLYR
jgi:hypothetical protein